MTRLEVRCCCQPRKLLGWLPVPEAKVFAGSKIRFLLAPACTFRELGTEPQYLFSRTIILPIETILLAGGLDEHLALKSEETPIEVLRRIPGFVEAPVDNNSSLV